MTILVDGENLFRALPLGGGRGSLKGKSAATEEFLQRLELAAANRDWEVVVVLDGPERFLRRETGPLVIRYAPKGTTADTLIERLVYQAKERAQVVVVTRDRAEADLVLGLGARVWDPRRFLEELSLKE